MSLKPNLDFDSDIDWTDPTEVKQGIPSEWYRADGSHKPAQKGRADELTAAITGSKRVLDALLVIMAKRYKARGDKTWSFESPNFEREMIYTEGYKQALKDIQRLIPKI